MISSCCIAEEPASSESLAPSTSKTSGAKETCQSCCASPAALVESAESSTVSKWIDPEKRAALSLDFELTTQDSKKVKLKDLMDKPTVIGFFFTRCGNPRKCPLAVSTMSQLQSKVKESGLEDKVRLLMITYDSDFDTPEIIKAHGTERGLRFNENVFMLRPEPQTKDKLFEALKASVNYSKQGVNIHSLQLLILDSSGRLVRDYHSVIWDNSKVIEDLKRLLGEAK
jgi:cytochrome oxidase Cu insertion factor (SCO1/SenC/PrrC family)